MAPVDPWNAASPKAKIPPSDATSQYPPPSGVTAIPTMGLFSRMLPGRPEEPGVAEGEDPAVATPPASSRRRRG